MPNSLSSFNFLPLTGGVLTGDLDVGLNRIKLTDGSYGLILQGSDNTEEIKFRNPGDSTNRFLAGYNITVVGNVNMGSAKTVDGEDVSTMQTPSGKLYLSAEQQNLVDSTWTTVEVDTIPTDYTDGIEDTVNHDIEPGIEGFYSVFGQVVFNDVVADKLYGVRLAKNAGVVCYAYANSANAQGLSIPIFLPCIKLDSDDKMKMAAISYAGVNTVDISSSEENTFLALQRVR